MQSFADNKNRTWDVSLNVGAIARVKNMVEIDLLNPGLPTDYPLSIRLQEDVIAFCDVLFAVIKPQADAQAVTDEMLAADMGGEALVNALDAFMEAWTDFFRQRRKTAHAETNLKALAAVQAVTAEATTRLKALDVEAEVKQIFGKLSTSSPESAESIPTP